MQYEQPSDKSYFGKPVEEYPQACQECPTMAALALRFSGIDVSRAQVYPLPETTGMKLSRMIFSRLGECSRSSCGLQDSSLRHDSDLE